MRNDIRLPWLLSTVLIGAAAFPSPAPSAEAPFAAAAPGISMLPLEDAGAKAIVAEFGTFLVLVESPGDEESARLILAAARERFPEKPVRFVFHTHHHDHSLGAIDTYLAAGIPIVTSPGNLEPLAERTSDPARFRASVLVIDDRLTLEDATNAMTALVIPKKDYAVPTEDYMVFHFPRQRALVTGCLYNKPLAYHEVINVRKPALRRFIADRGLDVDLIIPTNTTREKGFESVCTLAMLDETLVKGADPQRIADRLQERDPAALRADLDALTAEFSSLAPRAFDYFVCANTLKLQRQDPGRAEILLEVTERLFPGEPDVPFSLGVLRFEQGDTTAAAADWERALGKAKDREERKKLEGWIAETRATPPKR